jgi:hypothetical protein
MYKFNFIEENEIKLILNKHAFEKDLSENRSNVKETMKIMKKKCSQLINLRKPEKLNIFI